VVFNLWLTKGLYICMYLYNIEEFNEVLEMKELKIEKEVYTVADLFEAGAKRVKIYDDEDDEAPFVGTSVWDFPHYLANAKVLVLDYDEEIGEVDVVRLIGGVKK